MKKTRFIQQEEEEMILNDFDEGLNTVELGLKYGRDNTTIGKLLKRNGLKARNIKSKLTKEQVLEAYDLYAKEMLTTLELGDLYSVDANTIANSFRRYGLSVRNSGHIPEVRDLDLFEKIDSEEKAYFLGLLMADGSIKEDKTSYTLSLELQERDKHILYEFASFLGLPRERVRKTKRQKKNSITYIVVVGSTNFCNHLMDKGIVPNKMGHKEMPSGVPLSLMRHMIRGLIDGDGTVKHKNKEVVLYGGGKMTQQVSNFLYRELPLKNKPAVKKYKNSVPRMTTYVSDYNEIISYLYKDSTVFLKRKNPFYSN